MTHGRSLPTEPWAHARLTKEPSRAKTLPRHRVEGDVLDGALGLLDKPGCQAMAFAAQGAWAHHFSRLPAPCLRSHASSKWPLALPGKALRKRAAPSAARQQSTGAIARGGLHGWPALHGGTVRLRAASPQSKRRCARTCAPSLSARALRDAAQTLATTTLHHHHHRKHQP